MHVSAKFLYSRIVHNLFSITHKHILFRRENKSNGMRIVQIARRSVVSQYKQPVHATKINVHDERCLREYFGSYGGTCFTGGPTAPMNPA